ncbi:hypothetical protein D9M68_462500 [compost metagenome]
MRVRHAGRAALLVVGGHGVGQREAFFATRVAGVERTRRLGQRQQVGHRLHVATEQRGHVFDAHTVGAPRHEVGVAFEHAPCPQDLLQFPHDMHRQADRPRLRDGGTLDRLANPPGRISREAEPAFGLELGDGMHQPEVAFLDEVGQRHAAPQVVLGDVDHEPQVVLDHRLPRREVAGACGAGGGVFLGGSEEPGAPDLAQVDGQGIGALAAHDLGGGAVGRGRCCGGNRRIRCGVVGKRVRAQRLVAAVLMTIAATVASR